MNDRQALALKHLLEASNPDAAVTAVAEPGGVLVTISGPGIWPASARTADLTLSLTDDSPYLWQLIGKAVGTADT